MDRRWLPEEYPPARVCTLGAARGPVAAASCQPARLAPRWLPGHARYAAWPLAARRLRKRASRGQCVALHLTDARLAPLGRWLRPRLGVPVSVDVSPQDLCAAGRDAERMFQAVDALDAAFVFGPSGEAALRLRTQRVPVSPLPLVALAPIEPSARAIAAVGRTCATSEAGRPVIALPWTCDDGEWKSFRQSVLPLLDAAVVCLVFGVPDRRSASAVRSLLGQASRLLLHVAPLHDDLLAAVARYADAFLVPWKLATPAPDADALLRLALAASGAPVLASDDGAPVLAHERSAFIVRKGDGFGFRSTLDQYFGLPARQRHYIGAEFAASTRQRWPAEAAVRVYEERIASLTGHPAIPVELRAA